MARPGTFTGSVVSVAELNALGRVYTSGTRPTGADLYEGLEIYETDTDRRWMYTGAAWQFVGWATTAARPGVILTDAAQTFTTASIADITWGTEVQDVDGWTSGGSATLTVPSGWAGRITVCCTGTWSALPGAGSHLVGLVNGTYLYGASCPSKATQATLTFTHTVAAGDTIKIQGYQESGSNKDFVSRLEITWHGP